MSHKFKHLKIFPQASSPETYFYSFISDDAMHNYISGFWDIKIKTVHSITFIYLSNISKYIHIHHDSLQYIINI